MPARLPLGLALLLFCASTWAGNLLDNASFELVEGGKPVQWDLFVQPQPGAEGRIDDRTANHGRRSAMLHTPRPYETEPYNNWSQNLRARVAGMTLLVRGAIKCEDATGAALWLQCWSTNPLRVTCAATTSRESPVTGASDWTHVEMEVEVPHETDFAVFRCVLKGAGTAWFDALEVAEKGASHEDAGKKKGAPREKKAASGKEGAREKKETAPGGDVAVYQTDILEASKEMAAAIRALRETNRTVAQQLAELQKEIERLREELRRAGAVGGTDERSNGVMEGAQPTVPHRSTTTGRRVPPLVPHGYNIEGLE